MLHRPGYVQDALIGDGFAATSSLERSQGAAEEARQRWIMGLSEAWKTPAFARAVSKNTTPGLAAYDNAAEGTSTSDVPDDIAQLLLDQQEAYSRAHNQHLEEHPDASPEECDAVGRAAIGTASPSDSLAACEAVRDAAWRRSVERVTNAWRET